MLSTRGTVGVLTGADNPGSCPIHVFRNEASANPDVVSALSARVRAFYDKVAASRGKPYGH